VIVFPNCKINLGLHITHKREDGYHDLQTIFYPVPLRDGLEIVRQAVPSGSDCLLTTSGLTVPGNPAENIIVKAYQLIKRDYPKLPAVNMHLHKVIPTGAGLGGGSADGAFALQLLRKLFVPELPEEQLRAYALQLGSDCPFFLLNQPCYATGRGELMEPLTLDLSGYQLVLVNPGIHVPTGWAFAQISPRDGRPSLKDLVRLPVSSWKGQLVNDFEASVAAAYPAIAALVDQLYELGALYASMTGSGSTVFGIFEKDVLPQKSFPDHYFVKVV
jgi:4-diphosphocytidyl-2-C-methyl-D-erythritol kinase